ncbi:N-acetyl-alpha-D-glucosaminyl L-malate synthase BshA [Corticicoccus populi]|uniref:N-acetyl-alpha-D-glucosaminyl L-malate synthase BshA n=1 Tax=Corticicoccus populi TaxID=1812821 RepID=A0ABW5WTJ4_9STAP
MKIGITCYPGIGGSGIIATELGIKMAERGHEVHFITSNMPFRLNLNHENIFIHQTDINSYSVFQYPPYDITLASKISDVIKLYDLDIIHMHYAVPHAVCGILAREMSGKDVKIVTTLHGTDITVLGHDMSLVSAIRYGIEASDVTTSVSESLTEDTYQLINPDKELKTVYNFIDETTFNTDGRDEAREKLRKCHGIKPSTKVLMHTSNFRPIKRLDDVIRTFHLVQKKIDSALILVGDGPEMSRVRSLVKDLMIEDKVYIVGQQSDVKPYFQLADIFLLMSEKESFGLALLEAMNCGAVPIGSTAGGIREVIKHDETGFVVDVGDYKGAAEYVVELLSDSALYENMSRRMLEDVKLRFNSDNIIGQYEEIYKALLTGE